MRNADLEDAIRRAPDDLDNYEVYGDWLLENGEPQGELVLLAVRRRRAGTASAAADLALLTAEARILRQRERLFGELGSFPRELVEHDLSLGFLDSVRIYATGKDAGRALRLALTHRCGAFVRDVSVHARRRLEAPAVNGDRATAVSVWETLFDLGLPSTLQSIAVPVVPDAVEQQLAMLSGVPACAFPLRSVTLIAPHIALLASLRTLTLTAAGGASALLMTALVEQADALAGVERIILAALPPYRWELERLRAALPQLEVGWPAS